MQTVYYSESSPKIKFYAVCSPYGCGDNYIAALWSAQATDELRGIVEKHNSGVKNDIEDIHVSVSLSGDIKKNATKSSLYEEHRGDDYGVGHTVALGILSSNHAAVAEFANYVVKVLLSWGVKGDAIDVDIGWIGGRCRARSVPSDITADFIERCNNSRLEWYRGN